MSASWRQWTRRLTAPYLLVAASRGGAQALSLLAMLLAIANVDVETFGAYSLAWVATTVATGLTYTGFYEYLMRSTHIDEDRDTLFWLILGEGALLSALLATMGQAWLAAAGSGQVGSMLMILAPVPLMMAPTVWLDGLLVRRQQLSTVHLIHFASEAAAFAILAFMLWQGHGAWALVVSRLAPPIVTFAAMAARLRERPRLRWHRAAARRGFDAAWPLQSNALMGALSNYSADYLLAAYLTPAAAGAYRAASRLAMSSTELLFQPLRPINWSAFSRFEREHDVPGMADAYQRHLRFLAFIALPVLCTFGLLGPRIVAAFLQPDWAIAGAIVAILAFARAFGVFEFFLEPILVCCQRARLNFALRTGHAIVVLLGVLAIARFGPVAVAGWQLGASALIALVAALLIGHVLGIGLRASLRALVWPLLMTVHCLIAIEAVLLLSPWPPRETVIAAGLASALVLGLGVLLALKMRVISLPRP